MVASQNKLVLIESLSAMKESLECAYEFRTRVEEEALFIEGLEAKNRGYIVFSDYRRNEGRRRFNEVSDLIKRALDDIESCDSKKASSIYLDTLKGVLLHTRWVQVLEMFGNKSKKKK